jgi:hypothetical protein
MSPLAKLAGFASALVLIFAGAAFAGGAVDLGRSEPAARAAADGGMGGMDAGGEGEHAGERAAAPVRGLAVSDNGLTLRLARTTGSRGRQFDLGFRIVDRRGATVRNFDVEHTKRMHLIVVRRDMTGFQHLHPVQRRDGSWSVPVTLSNAGSYRVLADFSVDGTAHTLAGDLTVDGTLRSRDLPAAARSADVDGMRVTLAEGPSRAGAESALRFAVTRDGRPVKVQPYLGAQGHLVALRDGDLAYLHVHPDERSLRFMAEFPSAGRYRLFLQFKTEGRVHTAAFTQEVSR